MLGALSPATGPVLVAALLLLVAGAAKLSRPAPTGLALARTGLPGSDAVVRAIGAAEVAVGLAAIAVGGAAVGLLAAAYVAFAAFTAAQLLRARAHGEAADCGCFGDLSAPLDASHVVVNLALAALAAWGAVDGAGGWPDADLGAAVVIAGLSIIGAMGVRALLTDVPRLRAAMAQGSAP